MSERRINTLCLQGRIVGAEKFGNVWAIPSDAKKPKDERIKTGKYIKKD
nr:DNA-binding protein [Lachnospira multipara]